MQTTWRVVLVEQDGVISRRQLLDLGATDNDVRRLLRRRELVRVHEGVYVDHTGPLTWRQRAWAAVLLCAPAALCDESALLAARGPGHLDLHDRRPVHVAIDHRRRMAAPRGVRLRRIVDLDAQVHWNTSPPRQRAEHATLCLAASARRDLDAVAQVADAVGSRLTTPARLAAALGSYARIQRREFLRSVITDVADGTCSALEHGYLVNVERPHGLPTALRSSASRRRGRSTATRSTKRSASSSSWTGACSTRSSAGTTPTSNVTWTPP